MLVKCEKNKKIKLRGQKIKAIFDNGKVGRIPKSYRSDYRSRAKTYIQSFNTVEYNVGSTQIFFALCTILFLFFIFDVYHCSNFPGMMSENEDFPPINYK